MRMKLEKYGYSRESSHLNDLLATREIREFSGRLLPELAFVWAGDNPMKRRIAELVGRIFSKGFFRPRKVRYEDMDGFIDAGIKAFEEMSTAQKADFLEKMIRRVFNGSTGSLLTRMAATLNRIHEEDPEFIARALKPGVKNWIGSTDTGELKECAGKSRRDLSAVIRLFNDEIWRYPAKVLLLLALVPEFVNLTVKGTTDTLSRFNRISPDLITDIILALTREIDGAALGKAVNELTELIRKIGTGSALIGEPGSPELPRNMAGLFEQILSTLDTEKFLKAKTISAKQGAAVRQSLMDVLKKRPEDFLEMAARSPDFISGRLLTVLHFLSILEEMPEEEAAAAMAKWSTDMDPDIPAQVVNLVMVLINRVQEYRPEVIKKFFSRTLSEIDPDLLAETSRNLMEEIRPDLILFSRPIIPEFIHVLCDALEPSEDEYEPEAARARERLKKLLIEGDG